MLWFCGGQRHRLGENYRAAFLQQCYAFRCELEHTEFLRRLAAEPEAHQLAADMLPIRARVFLANPIGGHLLVIPLPDLLGVRTGEYFHDMIQPNTESSGGAEPVDAREKLLHGKGPVEGFPGLKAIITASAVGFAENLT